MHTTVKMDGSRLCTVRRRTLLCSAICAVAVFAGLSVTAHAAAYYEEPSGSIRVMDYPAYAPCSPALLLILDRQHGWNKVRYDADRARYVVDANLVIGFNDGSETFFRIGESNRAETVEVRGNVTVYSHYIAGINSPLPQGMEPLGCNRLTIGSPDAPAIANALLIESTTNAPHTFNVGYAPQGRYGKGGELHVYYGRIGPVRPEKNYALALPGNRQSGIFGANFGLNPILVGAQVSWLDGHFLPPLGENARVENTLFDNGRAGLYNCLSGVDIVGCTFSNMDVGAQDGGCIRVTLRDCRFVDCRQNWALWYTDYGLTLIDCDWTPAPRENSLRCWDNRYNGKRQYPKVVSKRHVIVKVTDPDGKALTNAMVMVSSDQKDWESVEPLKSRVNAEGLTPGKGEPKAILMTEFLHQATDVENKPSVKEYSYGISAEAPGYERGTLAAFKPVKSWGTITIVLKPTAEGKSQ
jgi:hypothetical protein